MALAIMISAFGCINGMLMSGRAPTCHGARRPLFFAGGRAESCRRARSFPLDAGRVAAFLVLIRTHDPVKGTYGNLYSNLLDYVVSRH